MRGDRDQPRQHLGQRISRSRPASTRTLFGMERIATPIFDTPVQWLRVGDLQLHLFLDEAARAPSRHHLGLTIDDFDAAYEAVSTHASARVGRRSSSSCPRARCSCTSAIPAGNLIELNWPDAGTLDRSRYPSCGGSPTRIPQTRRVAAGRPLPRAGAEMTRGRDRRPRSASRQRAHALPRAGACCRIARLVRCSRSSRPGPGALGALPRADDGQVGDVVRLGRPRSEGLPDHAR